MYVQGRAAGRSFRDRRGTSRAVVVGGADARGVQEAEAISGHQGQPRERTVRALYQDRTRSMPPPPPDKD